jgi:hypothetical protein
MSEFTFQSFFNGLQEHTPPAETPAVEQQEEPVVAHEAHQEGMVAPTGIEQGQSAPSSTVRVDGFIEALKQRNMLSADEQVDPDELYEKMITRATLGARAQQENERLKQELESLRSSAVPQAQPQPAPTPAQPTPVETPAQAQARQRVFRELQKYDPAIEIYVERDEHGYAKPKADFGQAAIDAARAINDYDRATRQQAEMIINNPHAIFKDNEDVLQEMVARQAKAIVEGELKALREEQQRAVAEQQQRAEAQARQDEENSWHEQNKAKIFRLNPQGEIAIDALSETGSDPAFTSMGRTFMSKLNTLRQQLPLVDDLTRRSMALEYAELKHSSQQVAASQPSASPAPVQTPAQQKRTLGGHVAQIPNQNIPQASVHDAVAGKATLRLADMVLANPANSERVSAWR